MHFAKRNADFFPHPTLLCLVLVIKKSNKDKIAKCDFNPWNTFMKWLEIQVRWKDVIWRAALVPLLYFRKMAMVRGQILLSALVVNAGSTVQTMHSVSMTSVSTSELNWVANWTSPSRMLGRKGWRTCVLSDSFSWSQYLGAKKWMDIRHLTFLNNLRLDGNKQQNSHCNF